MNIKLIIFVAVAVLFVCIVPTNSIAINTIYDVVACTETTLINPGDNLTIYVYFVGIGNATENFILIYFNSDIIVKEASFMGEIQTVGLADKGTNVQLYQWNITMPKNIRNINPYYPLHVFWGRDGKNAPFTVTISTTSNTPPGEHDLKVIYLYKNDKGVWEKSTDLLTFRVQTPVERIEYETLKLSFTEPYLAALLAFLSGLGLYFLGLIISRLFEKSNDKRSHIQLLIFIEQEIVSNRKKAYNLQNVKPNALPQNRMEASNKDAVWSKIIEYPKRNFDLINQISNLYDKYGLLNRTIESGFTFFTEGKGIPEGLNDEIKRICKVIDKNSENIISIIKKMNIT